MKEKEAQLEAEVTELLRRAEEVDEEEDRLYGKDKGGDELPKELAFRESRLGKIREAKVALEAEAQAEQAESQGRSHPGVPEDKAQRNFTDADSRIMPGPGGRDFQQVYNCQAVVDSGHQVVLAARATQLSSDKQQAVAMVQETICNVGTAPKEVSADAGYYSARAVEKRHALGVEPFIPPDQTRHGRVLPSAPRGRIPQGLRHLGSGPPFIGLEQDPRPGVTRAGLFPARTRGSSRPRCSGIRWTPYFSRTIPPPHITSIYRSA